jgi:hypothetical protein
MRTKITGSTPCVLVGLAFVLAGCGHSSPGKATLSVTCDGSLMLAGASTISAAASGAGTTLSFPDPVNPGQTGTLPIQPGHSCAIAPEVGKSDGGDGHPSRKPAS